MTPESLSELKKLIQMFDPPPTTPNTTNQAPVLRADARGSRPVFDRLNSALEMRAISVVIAFFLVSIAIRGEPLVALDYHHSMRIPNSRVSVTINEAGRLIAESQSQAGASTITERRLSDAQLAELKVLLESVDWPAARHDDVRGVDGAEVTISYLDQNISLWSPDFHSEQRGLQNLQKARETIFRLSRLDERGMPTTKNQRIWCWESFGSLTDDILREDEKRVHQCLLGLALVVIIPGALLGLLLIVGAIATGIESGFAPEDLIAIALMIVPMLLAWWV
ncbi:MAG TPA: hypothetical protein VIT91_11630 [Chthoniobacterales bacterium]